MPDTSIYNKALQFLARRDYSERELSQKLRQYFPESETEIEAALTKLKAEHYLDDERFMAGRIRHRLEQGYGPNKIIAELTMMHGFSKKDVTARLCHAEENQEDKQALERLLRKRFSNMDFTDAQVQKKMIQYCLQRGFKLEAIKALLRMISNAPI